jgi:hypothetical protein
VRIIGGGGVAEAAGVVVLGLMVEVGGVGVLRLAVEEAGGAGVLVLVVKEVETMMLVYVRLGFEWARESLP